MSHAVLVATMQLATVALSACVTVDSPLSPEDRFPIPDECGDRRLISQVYSVYPGKVVKVIDGDSLIIEWAGEDGFHRRIDNKQPQGSGPTEVQLVCLEAPSLSESIGQQARQKLSARLLSRNVSVLLSPYQEEGAPLNVMIKRHDRALIDENFEQLQQGLARYRDFGPYNVDWWLTCQYKRAEDTARSRRRGIWQSR